MRVALLQLCVSDQPAENLIQTCAMIRRAAADGAELIATPEVTNCISDSRAHQAGVLQHEDDDLTLAALREVARERAIWLLIGSLALQTGDADGRFANRSFLISPEGRIVARYDKIHMFDVNLSETESYRESNGYRPGDAATLAQTPFGPIGMTVCYDLRFPHLYRALAQRGAAMLTIPAAFARPTGEAHWEVLLRARAIETGCFVLAPAQTGAHGGSNRKTHGHSMVVAPWGEIVAEAGTEPEILICEIDLGAVAVARQRVPSLQHDRAFKMPE